MVIFGAANGLRPTELFGLEQHDVDRELGDVYVRRAFANGRIKNTKELISRNFLKPSNGLEPLTPSLPWRFRGASAGGRRGASRLVFLCLSRSGLLFHPLLETP
jgi:hypothetical protein